MTTTSTLARQSLAESSAALAMARTLKAAGVDHVFGQSCPIAFFLAAKRVGIEQIGYRTENAGVVMADGFARRSGRVGVMAAQNGPAASLIVGGLWEALRASVPIVAIVQDVVRGNTDRNAFQEIDHEALFRPCTKWVRRLTVASRTSEYVIRAIRAATTGRPGPAVLIVPFDVLLEDVGSVEPPAWVTPALGRYPQDRSVPCRSAIKEALETIMQAERPLIVAGGGVHHSGASDTLARLQKALGVPVATTYMGKGAIDETDPLSVGVVGYVMGSGSPTASLNEFVSGADAVMFVGSRTNENGTASWSLFSRSARFIQIDVDPEEIGRNYEGLRLLGDARETLEALLEEARAPGASGTHRNEEAFRLEIARARSLYIEQIRPVMLDDWPTLRPERLLHELDRLPGDVVWVADASYSSLWVSQYLTSRRPGARFLTPRGIGGLGWGLPLAIGAKLADPTSRVIAIVGDGGFAHCWAELEVARRHRLPVTVVVLNNGVLGYQRDAEQSRFGDETTVCEFGPIDHVGIARAVGCDGVAIRHVSDIEAALQAATEAAGPFVIDAYVDPRALPPVSAFETLKGTSGGLAPSLHAH
jgi:acetolactate synthase-1/2/3 large subunit